MLERFIVVLGQVTTLFLLMGVGFVLAKLGMLTEKGTKELSGIVVYVVTPCVIIRAFPGTPDPATLAIMGRTALGLLLCYPLYAGLAQFLFRDTDPQLRCVLRYGCAYGNVGFMGVPLVQGVLGDAALPAAALSIVALQIMAFTHGAALMGGKKALSVKSAILNPGVIGLAIGLPLFLFQIQLPGPVDKVVGYLKEVNTPLAMTVIGAQLARANLRAVLREGRLYAVSAVKLLLVPTLTALILLPLKLSPLLYVATVILAATPSAGYTSIFAEKYDRDTGSAAQLVSLSHLLSIFTLPLMAVMAEALASWGGM